MAVPDVVSIAGLLDDVEQQNDDGCPLPAHEEECEDEDALYAGFGGCLKSCMTCHLRGSRPADVLRPHPPALAHHASPTPQHVVLMTRKMTIRVALYCVSSAYR